MMKKFEPAFFICVWFSFLFIIFVSGCNLKTEISETKIVELDDKYSVNFVFSREIDLFTPENIPAISSPDMMINDSKGNLIVHSKGSGMNSSSYLYIFNKEGQYIGQIGSVGGGPGEYRRIAAINQDSQGNIYLYDRSAGKMIVYDAEYKFVYEYSINIDYPDRISVDPQGNSVFLKVDYDSDSFPAVHQYDSEGNEINKWGRIPELAGVQRGTSGGGIVTDKRGNIYYTYMADKNLFRIDVLSNDIIAWQHVPDYYTAADSKHYREALKEVEETGYVTAMVRYAASISRTRSLFYMQPGYIIQETWSPKISSGEKGFDLRLEIWDVHGYKIATGLSIPARVLCVGQNELYFAKREEKDQDVTGLLVYELAILPTSMEGN